MGWILSCTFTKDKKKFLSITILKCVSDVCIYFWLSFGCKMFQSISRFYSSFNFFLNFKCLFLFLHFSIQTHIQLQPAFLTRFATLMMINQAINMLICRWSECNWNTWPKSVQQFNTMDLHSECKTPLSFFCFYLIGNSWNLTLHDETWEYSWNLFLLQSAWHHIKVYIMAHYLGH